MSRSVLPAWLKSLALAVCVLAAAAPAAAADGPGVGLVKGLYEAFAKGEVQRIVDAASPDVVWDVVGDPRDCRCFGRRKGKDGVADFFKVISEDFTFDSFEPRTFLEIGDTVVVEGHVAQTVKANGRKASTEFVHVFTFKDGKLVSFREFADTANLAAAIRG